MKHLADLRNSRDLGEWVHKDFTDHLNAALILNSFGGSALDYANPYKNLPNQSGFATLGAPDLLSLVANVACLALKAAWTQKRPSTAAYVRKFLPGVSTTI